MLKQLVAAAFKRRRRDAATLETRLAEAARAAEAGDRRSAETLYREAAQSHPDSLETAVRYGWFACEDANWSLAHALFNRASALAPENVEVRVGVGLASFRQGHVAEALASYEAALGLDPRNAMALQHLCSLAYRLGDGARVRALFDALQAIAPSNGRKIARALMLPSLLDSNAEIEGVRAQLANDIEDLERVVPRVEDPAAEVNVTAFYLAYHGRDDRELQERIAALHLRACPALAYVAPHCRASAVREPGRIRVGVVSRYLYRHSIGRVVQGLIAKLDRDRFAVDACSFDAPCDSVADAIERDADAWLILPRALAPARATLAERRYDVLLYPDIGMDPTTYFMSFARLAKVQCTTWGHPVTTGVPNVDYFLSTDYFEPEGAQANYNERLVTLRDVAFPGYYYRQQVPPPAASAELGFDRGRRVYYCPQALFKFHPDFDAVLAAILRHDAGGEIVITYDVELDLYRLPRLQARLRKACDDVFDRIVFLPRADRREVYLQRLQACEVVLDTMHYCGGNSSLDAISAGALIVTLPSGFNRGRHTYGFFRKMRFIETIAKSPAHYVEIAVRIATDDALRARLKSEQRTCAEALYEDEGAVGEIGRFFEDALNAPRTPDRFPR